MEVWLNGAFLPRQQALISCFDAGLQHAIGLFETMAAHQGTVFRLDDHVQRLVDSARTLLLSERLRPQPLAEAVALTVAHNGLESARVRLTVTGGSLDRLADRGARRVDPTILIDVQPPTAYPPAFFEKGVTVTIADGRANPFIAMAGHKTLNYWPRIHALQHAASKQAGEAIWFSVTNHLVGGSVSNAMLVSGGALVTPIARGEEAPGAVPSAVLPGITRAVVIEAAQQAGIEVCRKLPTIEDVLAADECFLTNSSWGVLPVVQVEGKTIASGEVGPVTRRLREAWLETVRREIG